jgi:Domain of Unknown Function (DUF928)
MKTVYQRLPSISLTAIALSSCLNFPGLAQPFALKNSQLAWEFIPPNDGAPDDRGDAGSRTECPTFDVPFQVLIPQTNFSLTLSEYPTFLLYIPNPISSPQVAEFILEDETTKTREEIYRTKFQVAKGEGIVSFRLPEDAPPLELGQKYRWRFKLFCQDNANKSSSDNGVILRTSLAQELPDAIAEKLEVYAQNGIWNELLIELAQLRCDRPEDEEITATWTTLLQHPAVGLEDLVSTPILEECNTDL